VDPDSSLPPSRLRRFGDPRRSLDGRLRVTVTNGRGGSVRAEGLARWLATVAPARVRGEVAIALASDLQVRALNGRYRRKDVATDVLSFPARDPRASAGRRSPSADPTFLGDIVIATGVARRQARAMRHAYRTELRVLALHGLLHLIGYDHDDDGDRGRMARVEERLRRKGGLQTGLIGRAARPARAKTARNQ
jgi:probable rRNA maturation factor